MSKRHSRIGSGLTALLAVVTMAGLARGSPDPDTFSVDRMSPSPVHPADLLNPTGPPPSTQVPWANLGLQAGDNVDAVSPGIDAVQKNNIIFFSVDRYSMGIPGPHTPLDVAGQAARNQQAGDIFVTVTPLGVASVPMGINAQRDNQTLLGLLPGIGPLAFNAGLQDDLDALSFEEFDLNGDRRQEVPVYFSLDKASPSLGVLGTPADILISPAPGLYGVYAPSFTMGLLPDDDLDALVLRDRGRLGAVDAGLDLALFSLAPGSPTLALLGASPADIFMTTFAGVSWVRYPAGSLGLLFEDNVNALEVQVPEPASLMLLMVGAGLILGKTRRK